jgi:hypothetical protein
VVVVALLFRYQRKVFTEKRRQELREEELIRNAEAADNLPRGSPNPSFGMEL